MSRKLLNKARRVEPVEVDGETYHVRVWSVAERMAFAKATHANDGGAAVLALRLSLCEPDGRPTFTEADDKALGDVDGLTAQTILDAALQLNGLKAGAIAEAKKD